MKSVKSVVSYMGFANFTRPVQGELILEGDRITFTPIEPVGKRTAAKLEEISGREGIASALVEGQPQKVLEIPVSEIESWKVKNLGSHLLLKTPDRNYNFTFYDLKKAYVIETSSLKGIGGGKEWKQALAELT